MTEEECIKEHAEASQRLYINQEERNEILSRLEFLTKAIQEQGPSQVADFKRLLSNAVEGVPVQEVVERPALVETKRGNSFPTTIRLNNIKEYIMYILKQHRELDQIDIMEAVNAVAHKKYAKNTFITTLSYMYGCNKIGKHRNNRSKSLFYLKP